MSSVVGPCHGVTQYYAVTESAFFPRLPDRPHLLHLIQNTKLLETEPTLFVAPGSTAAAAQQRNKVRSAAVVAKELELKNKGKNARGAGAAFQQRERPAPTPLSLATVMIHDLLFAKRGLVLAKEHKIRKKLEKYKPA